MTERTLLDEYERMAQQRITGYITVLVVPVKGRSVRVTVEEVP